MIREPKTAEVQWARIYAILKAAGCVPAGASEIVIGARRKDAHARLWLKALAASRRPVLQ